MALLVDLVVHMERLMSTIWPDTGDAEEPRAVSGLLRLPPEIILSVANTLPTESAASLALCCRNMSRILGPKCWKSLRRGSHDIRLEFLSSLAKDLPRHFPCRQCLRLHRISAIKWPRDMTYTPNPPCTSGWSKNRYSHLFGSYYTIYYPQIQLAMKQHRCGIDIGFPLEAFRHLEVRHHESPQKVVLSSADAQIVSDEFIMRFQTWTLVPWNRSDTFVEQLAKDDYMHDICVHGRLAGYPDGSKVTNHMISRVALLENGEDCQTRLFQCPYCYMDYMVDAKDFGEQGFAVITTKWVNFGPGRESPDIKWRCHGTRYKDRLDVNEAAGHEGEIRADFESQAEPSLEDLTSDNERRLFSTRKRRAITRAPDGRIWRWSGGARWFLDPPNSSPSVWERWLW